MIEHLTTTEASEFARYFIVGAINELPQNNDIQGRWLSTDMIIAHQSSLTASKSYYSLVFSAVLYPNVNLYASGVMRRTNNVFDFASLSLSVSDRQMWSVKGAADYFGRIKYYDMFAILSPHSSVSLNR